MLLSVPRCSDKSCNFVGVTLSTWKMKDLYECFRKGNIIIDLILLLRKDRIEALECYIHFVVQLCSGINISTASSELRYSRRKRYESKFRNNHSAFFLKSYNISFLLSQK